MSSIKRPFSRLNTWLMKKFEVGVVVNYPLRTSVKFVGRHFGRKELLVAEIGTYRGENALYMLQTLNIKKIYLIDPWEKYPGYNEYDKKKLSKYFIETKKRLRKFSSKVIYVKKLSEEALKDIPDNLDFIYIDGNHEYQFVKKDMEDYWGKLKKGGVLAGHDISLPGVSKAFCEFVQEKKLVPNIQGMNWWTIKK